MAGNTFGKYLKITTFGESHSLAIGGIIDGFPSGITIDYELIKSDIRRRKTNKYTFESQRKEDDEVVFLSGIIDNKTLGTPIAFVVYNKDAQSNDYSHLKDIYRPSHADYTYQQKYGVRDYRGGGRASARETLSWVIAGALAKMLLINKNIYIGAYVSQIGHISLEEKFKFIDFPNFNSNEFPCPDKKTSESMLVLLQKIEKEGDTVGGKISCVIKNCPVGLGEPVFDKLHAALGKAMLSINGVKGFEYGSGFTGASMKGSNHNDVFISVNGKVSTLTNHSGGIQGGISNGEDIFFSLAMKPVSSIKMTQQTIDVNGEQIDFKVEGRHDVCPVPRAIPIVEAMTALVIADYLMEPFLQNFLKP